MKMEGSDRVKDNARVCRLAVLSKNPSMKEAYLSTLHQELKWLVQKDAEVRKSGDYHYEQMIARFVYSHQTPGYTQMGNTNLAAALLAFADSKCINVEPGNSLLEVRIPAGVKNVRLPHTAYISYFNTKHRIPNCVIYELTATQVAQCDAPGAEKRKNYQFNADPMCSASPQWSDYKHSGYDRGHMAPANDMKWSKTSMEESFYMTNICPQLHALNDGCWRKLELAIHRWAKRD